MTDPLDVDSDRYMTLRDTMRHTGRSRVTIMRWVKQGKVRTLDVFGVRGFNRADIDDAEAEAHYNQDQTRKQP
ncbi:MAG: hypothetical protein WBD41_14205 [Rhodococcus sp. (in: high G+C Gram-positive bacteria)]